MKSNKKRALGLCVGASTLSYAIVENKFGEQPKLVESRAIPHLGNVREVLRSELERLSAPSFHHIAVTGRKLRSRIALSTLPEPEAVEEAYQYSRDGKISCNAIVSAGGETFIVYRLDNQGHISSVKTGNKCASGTGEFFLQQIARLGLSHDDVLNLSADEPCHAVSGRCSVFCKSDCTHATNKGVPRIAVAAGLGRMMAGKILELLQRIPPENIMLVGGVSRNPLVVGHLQKNIRGLIVPPEAAAFEAVGAALWALRRETLPFPGVDRLFNEKISAFEFLPPLAQHESNVVFKSIERGTPHPGDRCLVGLDVGSTTTKAVLLRESDNTLLCSVYLRTKGDPVSAARKCYRHFAGELAKLGEAGKITVAGVAVTGSGRQIAALHALTPAIINEIIAHATAAAHFDPEVDTIFEIGGQDAKYTHLVNGVPCDYAMNEACSAGTGSFLEESAQETLGVPLEDIAGCALVARKPVQFNDQCAAFISSDIKNAIQEGIVREDILAGLVYSVCVNYLNRVKGNRTVGNRIFVQGGVCYNRAVPFAFAALAGKPVVVPPEPGLMGAFGAALELKKRLGAGVLPEAKVDLAELAAREVSYGKVFACDGGREKCDRKCAIMMIHLEGRAFPFGGACNKYYNLRNRIASDDANHDLVKFREERIFESVTPSRKKRRGVVGINRSFLSNTYFPLYQEFFSALGFEAVLPDVSSPEGINRRDAAFCHPVEIAHGMFHTLLQRSDLDFIFLPHVRSLPVSGGYATATTCPFVQGEPYVLSSAFRTELDRLCASRGTRLISPVIDMAGGIRNAGPALVKAACSMGVSRKEAEAAFLRAVAAEERQLAEIRSAGARALAEIEKNPDGIGIILFGRAYNAYAKEANLGIPQKFASRGVAVIPIDALPLEAEPDPKKQIYWGMGQLNLRAAAFVARHPKLFGAWITNFSCGPDSFLLGYFRGIMGAKPSLTLELDSHSADAGVETRIEAFLDIITAHRRLSTFFPEAAPTRFRPASATVAEGRITVMTSEGERLSGKHPRMKIIIPSMGRFTSEAAAAALRGVGFNTEAALPPDDNVLKLGRAHVSCKECLPLILTTGTLLAYVKRRKRSDEVLLYFMPTTDGPCRFGQYHVFMSDLIRRLEIPNVATFALSAENGYGGLGVGFTLRMWWGCVIADTMEDTRARILANTGNSREALNILERGWRRILACLEKGSFHELTRAADDMVREISKFDIKRPWREVPVVSLMGEIYVRRDNLSRQFLPDRLAVEGIAARTAPVAEWIHYCDWCLEKGLSSATLSPLGRAGHWAKKFVMRRHEARLKREFVAAGLAPNGHASMSRVAGVARQHMNPALTGEAFLTIGSAITDVREHSSGVIAIGPFGCMPNRLAESILSKTMDSPFLAVEADGLPFSQTIEANLETFVLRAKRAHEMTLAHKENIN